MFDNREIASVILTVSCVALLCGKKNTRHSVTDAASKVFLAATGRSLLPAWLALVIWSAMSVKLMAGIGLWDFSLLKDTLLEIVFVGIPAVVNNVNAGSAKVVFRRLVLPELGIGAIVGYYITLEVMPLLAELLLQTIAICIALLPLAKQQGKNSVVSEEAASFITIIVGATYLLYTTCALVIGFQNHDFILDLKAYFLGVLYPIVMIPFIILLAYYSAYQSMFLRTKRFCKEQSILTLASLCLQLAPRLAYVHHFSPIQAKEFFELPDSDSQKGLLREFKHDVRQKITVERNKDNSFRKGEGVAAYGTDGLWLDRTQLHEIKRKLGIVESIVGSISYVGKSIQDVRETMTLLTPRDCVYGCEATEGRFVCWMSNPTGFTFAIMGQIHEMGWLRYEGGNPPAIEDAQQLKGFVADEKMLPNWAYDDCIDESYL